MASGLRQSARKWLKFNSEFKGQNESIRSGCLEVKKLKRGLHGLKYKKKWIPKTKKKEEEENEDEEDDEEDEEKDGGEEGRRL